MELTKTPPTVEIIKANFQLELSRHKYQEALQVLSDYQVTMDNVVEAQEKVKAARKFLKKFDEIKEQGKAAALAECRAWDTVYNDLRKPFDNLLMDKANQVAKIAQQLEKERQEKEKEAFRVSGIKASIDTFFLEQSQAIANAMSADELTRVEKLIGSHKANQSKYQEFLPLLGEKAALLTPLIKAQKEAIKKLEALKTAEKAAEQAGDDQAVIDAREAQEFVSQTIEEKKILVQESAIDMATSGDVVEVEAIPQTSPKPRRTSWEYEVVNIKELAKKMPDWVELTPKSDKIEEYLKSKKAEGIEVEEFTSFGIRFYLKKLF